MIDITVDHKRFRTIFVPTYSDFIMTLDKPFSLHNELVLPGLQTIWDFIFPYDIQQIAQDGPIKFIASLSIFAKISYDFDF